MMMNSSSVPATATKPRSAARFIWAARMDRGDWATGVWSGQVRSHWIMTAAGSLGSRRIVSRSRTNSMSPYPCSHEVMA